MDTINEWLATDNVCKHNNFTPSSLLYCVHTACVWLCVHTKMYMYVHSYRYCNSLWLYCTACTSDACAIFMSLHHSCVHSLHVVFMHTLCSYVCMSCMYNTRMYICHVCMYACTYACVYACMSCMYVHVSHVFMHVQCYVWMYVCMLCTYVHVRMHVCMYILYMYVYVKQWTCMFVYMVCMPTHVFTIAQCTSVSS